MKKAVLFDMDGILYDSERFYLDNSLQVLRSLGYQGGEEPLYDLIGSSAEKTWKTLYDLLDGNYSRYEIEQACIARSEQYPLDYRAVMFEDIPDTLERLYSHGIKMACCSSNMRKVIRESLDVMGIRKYFSFAVSAEEIERPKPEPDIYLLAAKRLNVLPEDCVVYEDSAMGIEAGKRAGMRVIARKDDRFGLDQSGADRLVTCAKEMADDVITGGM